MEKSVVELERLVNSGRYMQAWQHFGELLLLDLSREELAKAHLLAAITRGATGQWYSAVELGQLAERHATEARCDVLLGKVWANLCEFYRRIGDFILANDVCNTWFQNAALYPELESWKGRVYYNRALIRRSMNEQGYLADFERAVTLLRQVYEATPSRKSASHAIMACLMAAWVCYETGRLNEGDKYYRQGKELLDKDCPEDTVLVRELLLLTLNRTYQEGTDPNKVIELAKEFLSPGSPSTKEQEFWACWYSGMVYAKHRDHLPVARMLCTVTYNLAVDLKLPSFMNRHIQLKMAIQVGEAEKAE
ncbi:MAG TPA: hypothetical protein VGK74_17015 [Symbiobacteriaceae bacterium]|jgi:tetratricopeptide (TPR) repeat protein